jgi:hypothetical protein
MQSHSEFSSFREKTLEHIFVGECLKALWVRDVFDAEVLQADVDGAGYDIVMEARGILRHIQLKSSFIGAKTASVNINWKLGEKSSGCVIWIWFDPDSLALGPYRWFGSAAGEPLTDLTEFPSARHTKGDATGFKAERAGTAVVRKSQFEIVDSIDDVVTRLFIAADRS